MKKSLCFFVLVLAAIAVCSSAVAQTNLVVGVRSEYSYNYGYKCCYTDLSVGMRHIGKGIDVSVSASGGYSPKIETGNGYNYGLGTEIYWASPKRFVLLGGGVAYHKQLTSVWTKSSARASLGLGIGSDDARLYVHYYLKPWKLDEDPWLYGASLSARLDLALPETGKWHVALGVSYQDVRRVDEVEHIRGEGVSLAIARYF